MMTPAPTFRSRLWRWTKRLSLLGTLTVAAAVPAAAFGVPAMARTTWARARVENALARSIGIPVEISAMSWSWKEGLTLRNVSSTGETAGSSFKIESVRLQPRVSKLVRGKLRARAILENPEIVRVDSGTDALPVRLPRLGKKGLSIDKVDIHNGTLILKGASDDRNVRLSEITTKGSGRLENRTMRFELSSLSGSCDGLPFTGQGMLRVTQDGLAGELELKEAAAKESTSLRNALRAFHLTIRKAPAPSEPF